MPSAPSTSICFHSWRHCAKPLNKAPPANGSINAKASAQRKKASALGAITPSAARAMT